MKIGRIIHQQVMQLRWHFLACLGLIMVLPLEEGFVNLKDGAGFYSFGLTEATLLLTPLLSGLIACANIQADLDEKRYMFWRSKPVGVKFFMTLKYIVGLILALVVMVSPVIFSYISVRICKVNEKITTILSIFYPMAFIAIMTYSLCFFCNVLMRKTARAWLIGMAIACFLLLVPFILPLNLKDVGDVQDYLSSKNPHLLLIAILYLIAATPSLLAFIFSLIAASHNWHLQTNLKGLLWSGAALIFLLAMLFARQVANIKVLDEVKIEQPSGSFSLVHYEDRVLLGDKYVDIEGGRIHLTSMKPPSEKTRENFRLQMQSGPPLYQVDKELKLTWVPNTSLYYEVDGRFYAFSLYAYYKEEKIENENMPGGIRTSLVRSYKKVYLRSFMIKEGCQFSVTAVDLSDCLTEELTQYFCMRVIDDKIVVFVGNQCVSAAIANDGEIRIVAKNAIKKYSPFFVDRNQQFKIPLAPTEVISMQERIRFSIDFNYLNARHPEIFTVGSLVDIRDDEISFCLVSKNDIARYDVIKWDDQYVYCKFRDARPFTVLEQTFGRGIYEWSPYFVKDGMLYLYNDSKLMVLDIHSQRIRKLGHWERLIEGFRINEVKVLENGNILMDVSMRNGKTETSNGVRSHYSENYLYLLKNPE